MSTLTIRQIFYRLVGVCEYEKSERAVVPKSTLRVRDGGTGCTIGLGERVAKMFAYWCVGMFYLTLAGVVGFLGFTFLTEVLPVQLARLYYGMDQLAYFTHWLVLGP